MGKQANRMKRQEDRWENNGPKWKWSQEGAAYLKENGRVSGGEAQWIRREERVEFWRVGLRYATYRGNEVRVGHGCG